MCWGAERFLPACLLRAHTQVSPDEAYLLSVGFIVFPASKETEGKLRQDEAIGGVLTLRL